MCQYNLFQYGNLLLLALRPHLLLWTCLLWTCLLRTSLLRMLPLPSWLWTSRTHRIRRDNLSHIWARLLRSSADHCRRSLLLNVMECIGTSVITPKELCHPLGVLMQDGFGDVCYCSPKASPPCRFPLTNPQPLRLPVDNSI